MYTSVYHPFLNLKYSIFSKKGKKLINEYIKILKGGKKPKSIHNLCKNESWIKNQKCKQGPCWESHVFVGDECFKKGSCQSKEKLCSGKKNQPCYKKVCFKLPVKPKKENYKKCLRKSSKMNRKLCPRGYCTARQKFEVYPSAYANGYASGVCLGKKPDHLMETYPDKKYMRKEKGILLPNNSNLKRWFDEKWVNVCEKNRSKEGYKSCGTGKGIKNQSSYPYCRPYYYKKGTVPITVEELKRYAPEEIDNIFETMCYVKRSKKQGKKGKPTYIRLEKHYPKIVKKIQEERKKHN